MPDDGPAPTGPPPPATRLENKRPVTARTSPARVPGHPRGHRRRDSPSTCGPSPPCPTRAPARSSEGAGGRRRRHSASCKDLSYLGSYGAWGVRVRRRLPALPDRPRDRRHPGLAGRHRRDRQPGPRARRTSPASAAAGSGSSRCSTRTRPGRPGRRRRGGAALRRPGGSCAPARRRSASSPPRRSAAARTSRTDGRHRHHQHPQLRPAVLTVPPRSTCARSTSHRAADPRLPRAAQDPGRAEPAVAPAPTEGQHERSRRRISHKLRADGAAGEGRADRRTACTS